MEFKYAIVENNIVTNIVMGDETYGESNPLAVQIGKYDFIELGQKYNQEKNAFSFDNFVQPEPEPEPEPPTTIYSKFGFRSRFTLQELVGIDNAGANPTLTPEQKGTLNTIGKNFEVASEIDLTHAQTIQGVEYLASVGLLTQERATQILTP